MKTAVRLEYVACSCMPSIRVSLKRFLKVVRWLAAAVGSMAQKNKRQESPMKLTSLPSNRRSGFQRVAAKDGSALGLSGTPRQSIRTLGFVCLVVMLVAVPMTIRAQDLSEDGFATPNSVEGTLAATAERQSAGGLEGFQAWKKELVFPT